MPQKRNSAISVSYKYTGDRFVTPEVTDLSPQNIARRLLNRNNVSKMFGQSPIVAIVDRRLSDRAHRLLTLLSAKRVTDPAITLSFSDMAEVLNCSERKAQRCAAELQALGWVKATKKHNKPNAYEICIPKESIETPLLPRRARIRPCSKCSQKCVPDWKTGWCRSCVGKAREDRRRANIAAIEARKAVG